MKFSEIEIKRIKKNIKDFLDIRRPPVHIRNELDIACRINDANIEIYTIRPMWNDKSKKIEQSVAKAKYIKKTNTWKIYWQRADLQWHSYEPKSEVKLLEDFYYNK